MIEIRNLEKNYTAVKALRGVDLTIKPGEIFGLLGPNGAGKTTLISILAGYLKPSRGESLIEKKNIFKETEEVKKIIGLVPQEISLYSSLTGEENLKFFGRMYAVKGKELRERAALLLDFVGLKDKKDDLVKNYSGGMKRRLNLACGLVHNPQYLFLDEPTVGVDPQSREHIFNNIKHLNEERVTILYTTHYMEEAEKLCTRIAIMDEGRVIAVGYREELLANYDCLNLENLFLKLTGKELRD